MRGALDEARQRYKQDDSADLLAQFMERPQNRKSGIAWMSWKNLTRMRLNEAD